MNRQKLFLGVATLAVSAALVMGGCVAPADNADTDTDNTETITLGYIGPLTGDIASVGTDEKRAIELALEANSRDDVEVIFEDSHCDGQAATNAAQKLVNVDQVKVIMGAGCSDATLAAVPIVNENGVILFSSLSTSPELTESGGDYFFRNAPSDDKASDVMASLIAGKKIAVVTENNDFGQAYLKSLKTKLATQDTEPVVDEVFNTGTTDFKTILQKVKEGEVEVLTIISNSPVSNGLIVKQAKEAGLEMDIYGTDSLSGAEFTETAQDAAEGVYAVLVAANTNDPRVNDLMNRYGEAYGEAPAADAYTVLAYDRMNILLNAIDSVGYDADAIRGYLATVDYDGLGGQTRFDENGDSTILPLVLQVTDGKLVPVQ